MEDAAGLSTPIEGELLRRFLGGREVACPGCGYNLRDLTGDRCPECGQAIVLQLQLAEPRQGALLTGLIGLSAGAGLNGLLLVYLAIMVLVIDRNAGGMEAFFVINLGGLIVQGVAMLIWLRNWRRIRRLNTTVRWALAAAGWGLSLLNIIIFSFNIR